MERSDPKAPAIQVDGAAVIPILDAMRSELFVLKQGVDGGSVTPKMIALRLDNLIYQVQAVMSALSRLPDLSSERYDNVRSQASSSLLDSLTPCERQVTDAVLTHGTTARAAHALDMSEATLGHHRSNILRKLHVANFAQIARLFTSAEE